MRQKTLTDSYGKKALVTVYGDGAVCLHVAGQTLDFLPSNPLAAAIEALAFPESKKATWRVSWQSNGSLQTLGGFTTEEVEAGFEIKMQGPWFRCQRDGIQYYISKEEV
jgi:hypothetical protein